MILSELSNMDQESKPKVDSEAICIDDLEESAISNLDVAQIILFTNKLMANLESFPYNNLQDSIAQGITLNVFGELNPHVSKFVSIFKRCLEVAKDTELSSMRGHITLIQSLSSGKELTNAFEYMIKTLVQVFFKVQKGFMISALMQLFASLLAELISVTSRNTKLFKGLFGLVIESVSKILNRFQQASSGPYDQSFLTNMDTLFTICLLHSNAGLRNAAIAVWKNSFNNCEELAVSENLKNALIKMGKRYSLNIPGHTRSLSPEDEEALPLASFIKKNSTPKRVLAIVDEDSTDYVPISTPSSGKKMKLTEHQKEKFLQTKDKLPFYDEDSVQSAVASKLKSLPTQFDTEHSQSNVSNETILKKQTKENITEISMDEPRHRRTAIRLNFDEVESGILPTHEPENENKPDIESSDGSVCSRRSKAKSTPSKYQCQNRRKTQEIKKVESNSSPQLAVTPRRGRGRPARSPASSTTTPNKADAPKTSNSVDVSQEVEITKEPVEIPKEAVNISGEPVKTSSDDSNDVNFTDSCLTPEKSLPNEKAVTTPSTLRILEAHTPGILKKINSPSTSERKRLRVHFHEQGSTDNASGNDNEQNGKLLSRIEEEDVAQPEAVKSDDPIFPLLKGSTEPVVKIFSKLLPIANTGTVLLKRALKVYGVQTIGDLAKMPKSKIILLPIRIPRVQTVISALQSFHDLSTVPHPPPMTTTTCLPKATTTSPAKAIAISPLNETTASPSKGTTASPLKISSSKIATRSPKVTASSSPIQEAENMLPETNQVVESESLTKLNSEVLEDSQENFLRACGDLDSAISKFKWVEKTKDGELIKVLNATSNALQLISAFQKEILGKMCHNNC